MRTNAIIEVSDLIVSYDEQTLKRLPVRRDDVVEALQTHQASRLAHRVVRSIPDVDGVLDGRVVDNLLVKAHLELQRLEEEFLHGQRVLRALRAVFDVLERHEVPKPWRVVDVGCSIGYSVRYLTSRGGFGRDVDIVGADYNAALVHTARHLAEQEGLRCRFEVANAFQLDVPATVYLSNAVMHHFSREALPDFFARQNDALAVVHFDVRQTPLAPFGSWLFHKARMRSALAQHDGVASAKRAHPQADILDAARAGLPSHRFQPGRDTGGIGNLVFQSVVGLRSDLVDDGSRP